MLLRRGWRPQSTACWPCGSSTALPPTTSKPSASASRGSSRAASPTRIPSTCKRRRCACRSASRSPPKSRRRADLVPAVAVADYEAALADRSLFELEDRTAIDLDDEVEAASNERSTAARVSVELRDGRKLSIFVPAPKGSAFRPFTAQE